MLLAGLGAVCFAGGFFIGLWLFKVAWQPGAVRRLIRGMRGHAGNIVLPIFILLGLTAGGWAGGIVLLAMYGPLYLIGAWANGGKDGE